MNHRRCRLVGIAPERTTSASFANSDEERQCVPTCTARPSAIVIESGFSTYTSLPARQAAIV